VEPSPEPIQRDLEVQMKDQGVQRKDSASPMD
jgi:hypothetical protein